MRLRATSFLAASIVGGLMFAAPSAAQAQVACGYYTTGYNCYSSYQCGSCGGGLLTTPWAYRASPCGYYGPCQQQVYIPAVVPAPDRGWGSRPRTSRSDPLSCGSPGCKHPLHGALECKSEGS